MKIDDRRRKQARRAALSNARDYEPEGYEHCELLHDSRCVQITGDPEVLDLLNAWRPTAAFFEALELRQR